jgi:pyruvate/2-oxoglutarate dehydrogenase complex dihydrolipoamide acyltransferase (E2) component
MATDVLIPQVSESIDKGRILKWLKKVGDTVQRDEPLLEVETDKVDFEVPAPVAGVLIEILAKEGETVTVNAVVARMGEEGANTSAAAADAHTLVTPKTVFISYRRQDSGDVTGRIYDRLVQHFGREAIFKDVDSIPLGVDFRKFISDAVGQCNLLLAVIGRQWLNSQIESGARRLDDPRDFVKIEIEAALQRDIPVIPLLVQGAGAPGENDLPQSLQALVYRNAISIRPDPDFHRDVDRLITGIELHFQK